MYRNGVPRDYNGGRTKDAIIAWVTKKSGPQSATLTCEALEEKVNDPEMKGFVLAYIGSETDSLYTDAHLQFADKNE